MFSTSFGRAVFSLRISFVFLGALLGACFGPPGARAQTFTLDATRSSITISGTVANGPMTEQGAGSLTAAIGGTLQVALAGATVQFTGQSQILAQNNGSWQPLADGTDGNAPADFGAQATVSIFSGVAALRALQLDATSPAINLSSGKFESTNLIFSFPSGALSSFAYNVTGLKHGAIPLSGYATNKLTAQGSLATVGDQQTLTIPVDATFLLKLLSDGDTTIKLQGQLVALRTIQTAPASLAAGPWVTQPPTLTGVVRGDNGLVSVSADGRTLFSSDGATWSGNSTANTNALAGIAYGHGTYVAVGKAGTILSSSDGSTWTAQTSGTTNDLNAIDFANSLFVAVGAKGTIVTSPDGTQWTQASSGLPSFADLFAVKFGGGVFVAGGTAYIASSADGITWTANFSTLGAPISALAYGGGQFIAYLGYDVGTSPDGLTWTAQGKAPFSNIQMYGLAFAAGDFVVVGDFGSIFASHDGVTWTSVPSGTSASLRAVGAFGGTLYAAGDQGTVLTSTTATNWQTLDATAGIAVQLNGLATGNGTFVAVGEPANAQGVIETSPDGVVWTPRSSGTTNRLNSVAFVKDRFLAVGTEYSGVILSSPDGAHWSKQDLPTGSSPVMAAYGNQTFVVVGSDYQSFPDIGLALTSADGVTWTPNSVGSEALNAVAFVNNTFVAAGVGVILTSPDGSHWTPQFEDTHYTLTGISYGNGHFVVVGYNPALSSKAGIVVTSTDGVNWTPGSAATYDRLDDVKFISGTFYAAGWLSAEISSAAILASTNGVSWAPQSIPPRAGPLYAIAGDDQQIVTVGGFGTILRSVLAAPLVVPAFSSFNYSTVAPIRSSNPWTFSADQTDIPGLQVRFESTLTTNDDNSWSFLPQGSGVTQSGGTWTLNTTDVPIGDVYFRAIATAPGYVGRASAIIGPITVLTGIAPFADFTYFTPSPDMNGNLWTFSIVQHTLVSDFRVRLQSTSTTNNPSSWTDFPGGGQMFNRDGTWSLSTTNVPTGVVYFRAVASAPNYADRFSDTYGVFFIVDSIPDTTAQNLSDKHTYSVQDVSEGYDTNNPAVIILLAQVEFSIHFFLLQDPVGAAKILQNGYILAAEKGGSSTLTIDPGQTLSVAGITVGPGGTLVDSGTIHANTTMLGGSAGAAAIGALVDPHGIALFGQNADGIQAVLAQSVQNGPALPVVSNDGGSVVSNDGGTLISQDGNNLISQDGNNVAGSLVRPAVVTGPSSGPSAPPHPLVKIATGTMSIIGNYSQSAGTALIIGLSGPQAYDVLQVSGRADLGGIIAFGLFSPSDQTNLTDYYQPAVGSTFDVVVAPTVAVHSLLVRGPIWGDGLHFNWSVVTRSDGLQALRLVATHVPPLLAIRSSPSVQVLYPTNYVGYSLQSSADLSGNWNFLSIGTNLVDVPGGNPNGFFRLKYP